MTTEKKCLEVNAELCGIAEQEIKRRRDTTIHVTYYGNDIQEHLDRYFYGLASARNELSVLFKENELALIIDALNGSFFITEEVNVGAFPVRVEDAIIHNDLGTKWDVDGKFLVKKLETLNYFQRAAMVDAVEVWWNRVSMGEKPKFDELLHVD